MDEAHYLKHHELEKSHWWFVARRRIVRHLIEEFIDLSATARILDVGCGTGGTLKFLQETHEVWGVDSSELAVRLSKERGAHNVHCADIADFAREHDPFDMILVLDVMERIEDDVGFLKSACRALKPGGWALIMVPAMPTLWSAHDEINEHKRRYERSQLSAALVSAGLRAVYISYFNTFLFPLAFAERMTSGLRKKQASAGLAMPPAWLNRWLERIFTLEGAFLGSMRFPVGLSLLGIARKPE